MKTVAKIIDLLGGLQSFRHARVESSGFMPLVIERIGTGPRNLPLVSVAHYGEQNGDLMADPEMTFEIAAAGDWLPVSFTNHYAGLFQEAVWNDSGRILIRPKLTRDLAAFARIWNRNLNEQGFFAAAQKLAATIQETTR